MWTREELVRAVAEGKAFEFVLFWGHTPKVIGMGASNPDAQNPATWRGRNLLGFALVEARRRLFGRPTAG